MAKKKKLQQRPMSKTARLLVQMANEGKQLANLRYSHRIAHALKVDEINAEVENAQTDGTNWLVPVDADSMPEASESGPANGDEGTGE